MIKSESEHIGKKCMFKKEDEQLKSTYRWGKIADIIDLNDDGVFYFRILTVINGTQVVALRKQEDITILSFK